MLRRPPIDVPRSPAPERGRRAAFLLTAFLVLAAVACTDDGGTDAADDRPALEQITAATVAEGSVAYSGETRFADGATGAIDGVSQVEPPAGEVSFPVGTSTGVQPVTVRWVGGDVFVQRAVTPDPAAVSFFLRADTDRPWNKTRDQQVIGASFDAYDPFRLLDRLTDMQVVAEDQGAEEVDGAELDRYVVASLDPMSSPGGARTIELLTDADQRLQVVRLIAEHTIEYAMSEYGVTVAPVPPPDDQIGASRARPAVEPTGPFEMVASGSSPAVTSWSLLRAPGTDGGTCWRFEASTPVDPVAAQPDGTTCITAPDPEASPDDQVEVVVDAGSAASFDAVVAVTPPDSTGAQMRLADGTRVPLAVDPNGFVVYVGPKTPLAVVFDVTVPGGSVVTCGPGSISELEDLNVLTPDDLARLDRAPWLCLEL